MPIGIPPGPPTLSGYTEGEPLVPNSDFSATCQSCGGTPSPTLRWVKAGTPSEVFAESNVLDPTTNCVEVTLAHSPFGYRFADGFRLRCLVTGHGLSADLVLTVGESNDYDNRMVEDEISTNSPHCYIVCICFKLSLALMHYCMF